ncbi:UDP-N-acetylmuramoyl-tripeptide--D-alanyl-D-alanine ligase [Nocardioides sp. Bht2]|uniref:UDP-N-acetylmuramoyl-tripeptide--D-alanyl-D- alanine ligase n=1 Tax=Nocardioides sp. Bht2 TaxID=3392297 RepID=UPI0039B4A5DF
MIPFSLAEIAAATGGTVVGDADVVVSAPAVVDSRLATAGALFVAVPGEHVDGHDFADAAGANGAVAVLGTRATGLPTVVVADPVRALGRLARAVRDRLPQLTVVAMTGSQGKTGTKDYLAQILATDGPTVATAGNFNNELGVPLTVLRAEPETRYLVVEMGARGLGHIDELCEIARPQIGAVLNVGSAHASEFGSLEVTAQAKGELIAALPATGTAVINTADGRTRVGLAAASVGAVLGFGEEPGGDPLLDGAVTWREVHYDDLGRPRTALRYGAETAELVLRQIGTHQVSNAAAAAALALAAGLHFDDIVAALNQATRLSRWRMELTERADGLVILNDAYNANPDSMTEALHTLHEIGLRSGRRTVAVLGEMKELGAESDALHASIGSIAMRTGIDVLVVIGAGAAPIAAEAARITSEPGSVVSVADRAEALAWLREKTGARDVVLVKASRSAGLESVAEGLAEEETR